MICLKNRDDYIYNGYIHQTASTVYYPTDEPKSYFVNYKQYARYILFWSPVEGVITGKTGSFRELADLSQLLMLNLLTFEQQVKNIPWPQLDEWPEDINNIGTISDDIINQFIDDLPGNQSYKDVTYRGTYDGVIVMAVDNSGGYNFISTTYNIIENREIIHVHSRDSLFTYKNGSVYTLQEAYENGIISYESICKIPYWYRIISE